MSDKFLKVTQEYLCRDLILRNISCILRECSVWYDLAVSVCLACVCACAGAFCLCVGVLCVCVCVCVCVLVGEEPGFISYLMPINAQSPLLILQAAHIYQMALTVAAV